MTMITPTHQRSRHIFYHTCANFNLLKRSLGALVEFNLYNLWSGAQDAHGNLIKLSVIKPTHLQPVPGSCTRKENQTAGYGVFNGAHGIKHHVIWCSSWILIFLFPTDSLGLRCAVEIVVSTLMLCCLRHLPKCIQSLFAIGFHSYSLGHYCA